jgi:subtilase family serine protease
MPARSKGQLAIVVTVALSISVSRAPAQDRIQSPIVDSDVVDLPGSTHPLARAEFDRGPVPTETLLERIVLVLQPTPAQQQDLDALSAALQQPDSTDYHRWLTPEQYGDRFGASAHDVASIAGWLQSHGFTVEPVPAGRNLILFSGTAQQVTDAFHTEIHQFEISGQSHIANVQDPQIPRALSAVVAGILSLHDFRRISATSSVRAISDPEIAPENTQGTSHYLFPADFATIYDLNPLYSAAVTGSGASIAIVGRSNINLGDVRVFRSTAALPVNQPAVIVDGADPGLVSGDQEESTLDVEWSGAVAPAASVKFVVAASTATSDGVDLSVQYIVNHRTAPILSVSYGNCETDMGSAELAFYNTLWQQAASEGISAFVSSGDSGAAGCSSGSSTRATSAGINGLCSSPYSTCVGGTEFKDSAKNWSSKNGVGGGSVVGYISEEVWNESAANGGSGLWSSGGGISRVYTQPAWQKGVSDASSEGMRAVPDVSLTSANHDGYLIVLNGSWYVIAGTSAASPSYAGIMSLVVEKQGGVSQGNANPTLYGLLDADTNPFHPTPSGNNSVPGVTGFTASGASYNLATGLGSIDAHLLIDAWPVSRPIVPLPDFTLTPSIKSESLVAGKSATFTVLVTGTGGYSGAVSLNAIVPRGISLTFNPTNVKPGVVSTATLAVADTATIGTNSLVITGIGSGINGEIEKTVSLGVTVEHLPTLSLTMSSTKLDVTQGASNDLAVTVVAGGSYTGSVTLAVSGLPAGVFARWSVNDFALASGANRAPTLTLTATSAATLGSAEIRITATGDGVTTETSATVRVMPAPAIQIAISETTLDMQSAGTQSVYATVTLVGGVQPPLNLNGVAFTVKGLPIGITATWTAAKLARNGTLQSKLTLAGSKLTPSGKEKLTIATTVPDSVSGIFYTANEPVNLVITKATAQEYGSNPMR